jgi:beta-glucosidase
MEIGMDVNSGFSEPYNWTDPNDIEAVNTKVQFEWSWYVDPLVYGKYPDVMV